VPPAACPHQRTPIAPSWPPRIIAVTSEIRTGQRQELFFEMPSNLFGWALGISGRATKNVDEIQETQNQTYPPLKPVARVRVAGSSTNIKYIHQPNQREK
jgi:hypothetical protein